MNSGQKWCRLWLDYLLQFLAIARSLAQFSSPYSDATTDRRLNLCINLVWEYFQSGLKGGVLALVCWVSWGMSCTFRVQISGANFGCENQVQMENLVRQLEGFAPELLRRVGITPDFRTWFSTDEREIVLIFFISIISLKSLLLTPFPANHQ